MSIKRRFKAFYAGRKKTALDFREILGGNRMGIFNNNRSKKVE